MPENTTDLSSLPIFANRVDEADVTSGGWAQVPTASVAATVEPSGWNPVDRDQPSTANPASEGDTSQPMSVERQQSVDWSLVRELRAEVARQRSGRIKDAGQLTQQDELDLGRQIVAELVQEHADATLATKGVSIPRSSRAELKKAVEDAVFGLGRLQPLIEDDRIENIELFGADGVMLEYADGSIVESGPVAESDEDLVDDLNFLAANTSSGSAREFSTATPQLHMRLPDGSRLAASMAISPRPQVTIRRHRLREVTLADLVGRDMLTPEAADFLSAAVRAQKTMMIAGPQGGGKTTLLRACCAAIDPWENVGTIESEYELHLHELRNQHKRIRAWEARPGTGEVSADGRKAGEVTMDDLTESVWRHNLDRLILGEVRGREAAALMKVISGIQGAMWTVHAPTGRAAIERMVTLMMESGPHVTVDFARRQVTAHVDLIVQIGVSVDPVGSKGKRTRRRYISEIIAVEDGEAGQAATTDIFAVTEHPYVATPLHAPPPKLLRDLQNVAGYTGAGVFAAHPLAGLRS